MEQWGKAPRQRKSGETAESLGAFFRQSRLWQLGYGRRKAITSFSPAHIGAPFWCGLRFQCAWKVGYTQAGALAPGQKGSEYVLAARPWN